MSAERVSALAEHIRDIPDFPKQGILFKDITTLLKDAAAFRQSLDELEERCRGYAVDKVIGWAFLEDRLPLSDSILMISGRGSFEIQQKALAAGIPIVCAVSAPSSLAVDLARRFDQTLIGFLRESRFNIYSSAKRIRLS